MRQIHPRKAVVIKAEVEKLLRAGFNYPIPLTDWVSNIVHVNKKQGKIRICIDYRNINRACPKDNYPTPYIDQIIDDYVRSEIFSFMDGFPVIIKSTYSPLINQKRHSFVHRGHLLIAKLPFGLKNAGETFQRAMSYAFDDIKHIVQPYLDDLPAHSRVLIRNKESSAMGSSATVSVSACWKSHINSVKTNDFFALDFSNSKSNS